MTSSDVRARLVHVLRLDLVGPEPDGVHVAETLSVPPSRWYARSSGILAVRDRPVGGEGHEVAFVTSGELHGVGTAGNVEAGALIRSRHFASQLRSQFDSLIASKQIRRLPGF